MPGIASRLRRLTERRPSTSKERHRAWWFLLAIAVAMQGYGMSELVRTEAWSDASATATGTVVGHDSRYDLKRGQLLREIVDFVAPDGTPIRFIEPAPHDSPFAAGARVPVRFRASDPSDARIDSSFRIWEGPVALIAIGVLGTIFLAWFRRRLPPLGGSDAPDADARAAEPSR